MSKLTFDKLLKEYISKLEIDYKDNLENSKHPIFSVIQNTFTRLRNKYYYSWFCVGFTFIVILFLLYYYFFIQASINLIILLFFFVILFATHYIVVIYVIKLPDLSDVNAIGDRVLLVREKIKNYDFDFHTVKEMISDINNIYYFERIAYLKRYYELTYNAANKKFKEDPSPLEKYLTLRLIIKDLDVPIKDEETKYLIASLLRVGSEELTNNNTKYKLIDKILFDDFLSNSNLKKSEIENIKILKEEVDCIYKRMKNTLITVESLKNKLSKNIF